jgi:phosphate transport system substrate-binding protein
MFKRLSLKLLGNSALAVLITAITLNGAFAEPLAVDPTLPGYKPVVGLSGNLNSVGSDTLNNLMTLWGEKFNAVYPTIKIQVEGKGSSTAPPALISSTAQLGPMSREMKGSEIDAFESEFGYKPMAIRVAVDALAVFVHKDNPIKGLSLAQVDAIFSKARRRGLEKDISSWEHLGLEGSWASQKLSMYGRNSASGTYGFFKKLVLDNGDFKDTVKEQPGSASVVQGITVDKYGIGYSGIGYQTSGIRAIALSEESGGGFVEATAENSYSGEYPLARFLYIYVNKAPGKPLDSLTSEFIRLVLSKEGQEVVIKDGYYPITGEVVKAELEKLN